MANQNEVTLEVNVDTKEAEKSVDKLDKSFEGFSDTLKKVAAGFLAFEGFKLAAGIFSNAISEAAEAEQNVRNLNIALANVGALSASNSKEIQDFASAIQETTTVTDDAALSLFTLATNVGLNKDQAKLATEAAINLSAATGKDLDASLKAVTDTLSGQSGKLSKTVSGLKNLTEEELKAGKGIDLVAAQFKGFAEAATGTFNGSLTQTKNSFGELLETLGGVVVQNPTVVLAIKAVGDVLKSLTEIISNNSDTLRNFVSDVIIGAINAFRVLVDFVKPVVFGIEAMVNGFILFDANLRSIDAAIYSFANETIASLIDGLNRIVGTISGVARDMVTLAGAIPGASKAFGALGINLDDVETTLDSLSKDSLKSSSKGLDSLSKAAQDAADDAGKLADSFDAGNDIAEKIDNTLSDFDKTLGDLQSKMILSKNAVNDLTKGLKNGIVPAAELTFTLSELAKGSFDKVKSGLEQITDEINKATLSTTELATVEKNKAKAQANYAQEEITFLHNTHKINDQEFLDKLKLTEQYKLLADERERLAKIKIQKDAFIDIGNTIGQGIAKGAEGAKDVIIKLGGKFVDAIAPGFGGIAETFLGIFAQGPDATKKMVRSFVDAIPDIIVAIADAAPAFVEALLDQLINKGGALKIAVSIFKAMLSLATGGEVGKKMAAGFVQYVQQGFQKIAAEFGGFFTQIIPQAFSGVIGFFSSFSFNNAFSGVANFLSTFTFPKISIPSITIGTPPWLGQLNNFISNLFKTPFWIKQAENFINNLYKFKWPSFSTGSGSGGNGTLADIGHSIGLASGGTVPSGFPNDTFAASLTSGEMVVPKKDVGRLNDFLDNGGHGDEVQIALLGKILTALNQPQTVQSSVNLNGQTLANIILQLSRNNARLTA